MLHKNISFAKPHGHIIDVLQKKFNQTAVRLFEIA